MSNRKENLKKTLGITEYPWSSDDDDDEETPTTVPDPPPRRQSHFDMPGTSGTSGTAPTVPPEGDRNMSEMRKNQARMERDVFWSLLSNPRRVPSLSLPRNSSTRVDVPLALISRASTSRGPGERLQPSAGEAHQRLLAIRKLNRNPGYRACKAFPSLFAGGQQQQHERPGRSSRDPLIENLANAAVARATQNYMRAKQAQAHERPANPQRDEATFSDSPSVEVEELQAMGGANSPGRDETVNVDQSDDDDVEMEPADESPSLVRNEDAAEQNDENDNSQGDGAGNTSAVTLEEIVEIDVEPDGEAGPSSAPGDTLSTHCTTQEEATNNAESTNNANTEHQPHGIKRKHESPEESEPASVWEFNQSLLRLLECPVCLEWMEPPMSQCRRGHLVCGRCRARLAACPVCRTAFSSVRNRAMEGVADMLRYPCRHGCGREVRLRRRAPHEASCGARRYRCVVPTCADRPPMPHADLAHHFQSKHQPIVIAGAKHSFKVKVNAELHENWVIMALRELFHLRVDVDVRSWGLVVYAAYIGPKCCADTYTYEVTVKGQFNSRKLVYTRATHCDLECSSLNVSRQDCFHLTLDQALNFLRVKNRHCEPEEFLHFSVEITKREDSLRDDSDS